MPRITALPNQAAAHRIRLAARRDFVMPVTRGSVRSIVDAVITAPATTAQGESPSSRAPATSASHSSR